MRLSDEQQGTATTINVPLRWIVVAIRLLAVAALASLALIAVGLPLLREANANHDRSIHDENISRCWNGIWYDALELHQPRPVLIHDAQACATLQAKGGQP